jgi:hypothetical protein
MFFSPPEGEFSEIQCLKIINHLSQNISKPVLNSDLIKEIYFEQR